MLVGVLKSLCLGYMFPFINLEFDENESHAMNTLTKQVS